MRLRVSDILGMRAAGASEQEILGDSPDLEPNDICAALAYAATQLDPAVLVAAQ